MPYAILACRMDLPFYLRLPSEGFLTWDPEQEAALLLPYQRLGEVSFSRTTSFRNVARLLDSPGPAVTGPVEYRYCMTCSTQEYGEVPTLRIEVLHNGGFSELRAYSEIAVFLTIREDEAPPSNESKARAFVILNHFIDLYRLITQDPYVHRLDGDLDLYVVDYSRGMVPTPRNAGPVSTILQHLDEVSFSRDIGPNREIKIRLNTLEDLFPGRIIADEFRNLLLRVTRATYDMPLHYELILSAQSQLRRRNYHIAVTEAETAFEVYVARRLVEILVSRGALRNDVLPRLEDPRQLGLLGQRLRALDVAVAQYRVTQGLTSVPQFVSSTAHSDWRRNLYDLRNRVVHEGWRDVTFDQGKQGIAACKSAIKALEERIPGLADPIQIYVGVDHLRPTPGRLGF